MPPSERGPTARPVVAHSVNPYLFGTGSWIHAQVIGLRRWRPIVVCKRRENEDQFSIADVYALTALGSLAQLRERIGRRLTGGRFPFMRAALQRNAARVVHSHFASQGWTDLPLVRGTDLAHITSFYGADIWKNSRDATWRARYAELFELGDAFLVEGPAMRDKVLSLGCPPQKVVVQHLGVDLAGRVCEARRQAADGFVHILVSGRAVEKKGLEFAVDVFAQAVRQAPHLRLSLMVIATSDAERERLARVHERVAAAGIADRVDFPPSRSYADFRRSLYGYHIYFAPSRHAANGDAEGGAPVSILDMSATGMPIVASRHCDIPEVAPDGVAGLLFDENDVAGATAALIDVATAPERWAEWGRAGRAHVEREYDVVRQVARLEDLYDRWAQR